LYNKLYADSLINTTFDVDYTIEENYAFSMFGGESSDPEKVKEIFLNTIQEIKDKGINHDDFEMTRRALLGRYVRKFNSIENISNGFISVYFRGVSLFDYFDVYDKISFEKVEESFRRHFNPNNFALSLVKPI
ncbi:MAG: peptidase M16, partial [Eubacteriales bacterium]|nr:peptidase M16 [Eubacteriales bacterium]